MTQDLRESLARIIRGPVCDATGEDHEIITQGTYRFCARCGETVTTRVAVTTREALAKADQIIAGPLAKLAAERDEAMDHALWLIRTASAEGLSKDERLGIIAHSPARKDWPEKLKAAEARAQTSEAEVVMLRGALELVNRDYERNCTFGEMDRLRAEVVKLRSALEEIISVGVQQVTRRIGDMYDPNGWEDHEVISDEAEIAREALSTDGEKT